jgi:hypothetical protein
VFRGQFGARAADGRLREGILHRFGEFGGSIIRIAFSWAAATSSLVWIALRIAAISRRKRG